jgi:hypothetical protein
MAAIFPNEGKLVFTDAAITGLSTMVLRLYKNNYTPGRTTTNLPAATPNFGNFVIADYPGYADVNITGWVPAVINADFAAEALADTVTFLCTSTSGGNGVYGCWIEDNAGNIVAAERFAAFRPMAANGDAFNYTPRITEKSEFSN